MVGLIRILGSLRWGNDARHDPDAMQGLNNVAKDNKDNQTDYTANSRQAFSEIAKQAFANSVNIPPTLYKNQGEIITLITEVI